MTIAFAFKGASAFQVAKEKASQVPVLKSVLKKKARNYDPEKDIEINECSICLVDFSVDDPK